MNETTHNVVPAPFDTLHAELRSLIASSRQRLAGAVNAELTRLYGSVGARLRSAQTFAQSEIVATLSRQLSWSHFVNLLPHQTEPDRQFYASRTKRRPSGSSCAPNPAANRWRCCKCTKTASPWPNTGPNCHPKRSWSKSCMQHCSKRVSGWRGVGCCWGTWMTSDDMKVSKCQEYPVVTLPGVGHMLAPRENEKEAARVFYVAATRATQRLVIGVGGVAEFGQRLSL